MHNPLHPLLLLSDSALPLGSFAFSSGLESFLAHLKYVYPSHSPSTRAPSSAWKPPTPTLLTFLEHSIHNAACTLLPFVLAGWSRPDLLAEWDDVLDASTPCTVAGRASTAQGRALVGLWGRALRGGCAPATASTSASTNGEGNGEGEESDQVSAWNAVESYVALLSSSSAPVPGSARKDEIEALLEMAPQAHLPPLFGAVSRAMGLGRDDAAYVFLLNHAKAVLSAMVRAGVMGPYQSQSVLAGREIGGWIMGAIKEIEDRGRKGRRDRDGSYGKEKDDVWALVDSAGVSIPATDLWMGRHELLYSRIFNS
ncbi:UreF-like protein [Elsinoe fawcettii]|nr:UreF-like protein [Elsinoe fawcettii]